MVKEITTMPDSARLWVYQADRKLTSEEMVAIGIATERFLNEWAAHGQELLSAYHLEYDQFLVIAVDESRHAASGCSIDASVGLVRNLEQQLGVSFLDRTKVALLEDGEVRLYPLSALKSLVESGTIKRSSKIFNNSVASFGEWKTSWIQDAGNSWLKRYFS